MTGTEVCDGGNVNLWPGNNNDQFMSLKVTPGETVIMFADDAFHGYGTTATKDVYDLRGIGMNGISSYIITPCACFYTRTNFEGDEYCYQGKVDLWQEDPWINDEFQSVKIPSGLQVIAFGDDAYHGYSTLLTGDIADLETKGVKNFITSLIVTSAPAVSG